MPLWEHRWRFDRCCISWRGPYAKPYQRSIDMLDDEQWHSYGDMKGKDKHCD